MALTQQEINSYEEFWRIADKNGDGHLTIQELSRAVKKYDPKTSDSQIAGMFCDIDTDGDKKMSKREFMQSMTERKKRSVAMMDLFKKYDKDNSKTLNRGEVIQMIKDCYPADKVNYIVGQFLSYSDLDGNGQITFDEFKQYFG